MLREAIISIWEFVHVIILLYAFNCEKFLKLWVILMFIEHQQFMIVHGLYIFMLL
jgi:hypothetical protein